MSPPSKSAHSVGPPSLEPYHALSYELWPPRTPNAAETLWRTIRELEQTSPDYVSVTYGASGSNRDTAFELLGRLLGETSLRPLAHLTCVGHSRENLENLVDELITRGIRGILALRGDAPKDTTLPPGDLSYASDLVRLVRETERRRTAHLCAGRLAVGVAAYATKHPESPSFDHDVEALLAKQAAGADFAITQLFFFPDQFQRLVAAARRAGVEIPIIPGLMPPTSVRRLDRASELAGLEMDHRLRDRLAAADDDAARRRIGVQATVDLANAALDAGAPGIHLYTFNEHAAALDVLEHLDLRRPPVRGGLGRTA
ncbi:methylenetetrahydrofolate reductase (NADPH) [Arthrobacter pigmenti]|uniref:Methylenetetrahydrofolate reductase n=1 Tax=Arthrobacter pigmenti TaxID=271432 RepID=A0A846RR34_9MICC|nr:methylenetetrahydrofolate reductase [Arthrobacter pigmenti]NJC22185.1 methylenetetrahydrofolate reductase (NADPH) [Arthrobacter pigmenti]